jgi:hypothetical protein
MCAGEVSRVLFMRSRRVTANRRHENQESGDYSQDIFSVYSLFSFLVQLGISPSNAPME